MKLSRTLLATALFTGVSLATLTAAQADASKTSTDFVKNASIGNEFEIESSKLALSKSQNPEVKAFAQQMITDHTKAGNDLKATLPNSTVAPDVATTTLDNKHQKMLDKLNTATGAGFDKKYISEQTDAHKETVSLFKDYAKNGDDAALKGFATQTLPTLEQHLQHVKQLKAASS